MPEQERSCFSCANLIVAPGEAWESRCEKACHYGPGTYIAIGARLLSSGGCWCKGEHWQPRLWPLFVAPKPGGLIEWASKMLGEGNRKESPMACETWQVEVVRVDRKTGRVVEYLLHLTTIENIQTEQGARQQALALAIKANPDATFGDDVDVNVRCPFRG